MNGCQFHNLFPGETLWGIDPTYIDSFARLHPEITLEKLSRITPSLFEHRYRGSYSVVSDVAVIEIHGLVFKEICALSCALAATSWRDLEATVDAALSDVCVQAILIDIDSSGGTISGVDALTACLRRAREAKPLASFIRGVCAGTAFIVAVEADVIYASSTSCLGPSPACQLAVDWFSPGRRDGYPEPLFDPIASADRLESLDQLLVQRIRNRRRLDGSVVDRLLDGDTFMADHALAANLIDDIVPFDAAIDRLRRGDFRRISRCA